MSTTLEPIFGAGLLGIIISAGIFGTVTSQTYTYYSRYPKDRWWMKALVAGLWGVLAAQLGINMHMIYVYLIKDFGDYDKLAVATWDWDIYIVSTCVCAAGVQLFFAYRLLLFTQAVALRWIIAGTIAALSLLSFSAGIVALVDAFRLKLFLRLPLATWAVDLWLGAACACDVLIAACMCVLLHARRTGIRRTDRLINRLMAYAVQTGAVTSVVEIMCLATFTGSAFHFGHILVDYPLPGLYVSSLLANLHARQSNAPPPSNGCNMDTFKFAQVARKASAGDAESAPGGDGYQSPVLTTLRGSGGVLSAPGKEEEEKEI